MRFFYTIGKYLRLIPQYEVRPAIQKKNVIEPVDSAIDQKAKDAIASAAEKLGNKLKRPADEFTPSPTEEEINALISEVRRKRYDDAKEQALTFADVKRETQPTIEKSEIEPEVTVNSIPEATEQTNVELKPTTLVVKHVTKPVAPAQTTVTNPKEITNSAIRLSPLYGYNRKYLQQISHYLEKIFSIPMPKSHVTEGMSDHVASQCEIKYDWPLKDKYVDDLIAKMSEDLDCTFSHSSKITNPTSSYYKNHLGEIVKRVCTDKVPLENRRNTIFCEIKFKDGKKFWIDRGSPIEIYVGDDKCGTRIKFDPADKREYSKSIIEYFDKENSNSKCLILQCNSTSVESMRIMLSGAIDKSITYKFPSNEYKLDKNGKLSKADAEKEIEKLKDKINEILINNPDIKNIKLENLLPLDIKPWNLEGILEFFLK